MANKSAHRVKAVDIESNQVVSVRASDAAAVPVLVTGPGNMCIPASIRSLPMVYGKPRRLTGIRTKGCKYPLVTWRDENGKRASCCICHEGDARDPVFASLAPSSRARLLVAVGVRSVPAKSREVDHG